MGFPPRSDATQRGHVEMIVVVVTLQNEIDLRQLIKTDAGSTVTFWPGPGNGTSTFRPDGVAEDIEAVHLKQHGRVADEGDADGATRNTVRGNGARSRIDPLAPWAGLTIQEPMEESSAAAGAAARRIVEMLAVEVIGGRTGIEFHVDCAGRNFGMGRKGLDAQD